MDQSLRILLEDRGDLTFVQKRFIEMVEQVRLEHPDLIEKDLDLLELVGVSRTLRRLILPICETGRVINLVGRVTLIETFAKRLQL